MSGYTWLTGDGQPDPPEQHEDENVSDKVYHEVDPQKFPEEYMRHVNAMTMEGLHRKSEIAAQLAWRDVRIAAKDAEIAELRAAVALAEARYEQANKLHLEEMDGHMRTNLAMLDAIAERDEARECVGRLYGTVETLRFHLRRDDHVTPPTARTATMEMIDACDAALSATPEHLCK